jgi:uncharacterized membrane protein
LGYEDPAPASALDESGVRPFLRPPPDVAGGGLPGVGAASLRIEARSAMKAGLMFLGIALIALGLITLAYQGITYTTSEKVVDLGPLKITAQREKTIPLPPILGGLALAGGIVLVVAATRKSVS